MGYVVYINHPRSCARIHSTNCRYFEHKQADTENGHWTRLLDSLEEAKVEARSAGKKELSTCFFCLK